MSFIANRLLWWDFRYTVPNTPDNKDVPLNTRTWSSYIWILEPSAMRLGIPLILKLKMEILCHLSIYGTQLYVTFYLLGGQGWKGSCWSSWNLSKSTILILKCLTTANDQSFLSLLSRFVSIKHIDYIFIFSMLIKDQMVGTGVITEQKRSHFRSGADAGVLFMPRFGH